jgi:hypothetical protein
MQPWVAAKRKEIYQNQDKAQFLDPRVRCLQAGVPRANTPVYYNSYQILQTPGYVVIVYEWNHMTRVIPLDNRPHLDPRIRLAMGDSRGRWEGNTLVVDVTNFTTTPGSSATKRLVRSAVGNGDERTGVVHSPELHVVRTLHPGGRARHSLRGENRGSQGVHGRSPFPSTPWFEAAPITSCSSTCHEGNRDGILMATGVDIDPCRSSSKVLKRSANLRLADCMVAGLCAPSCVSADPFRDRPQALNALESSSSSISDSGSPRGFRRFAARIGLHQQVRFLGLISMSG